ncbi:prolipoprotein diacylglyceryl transferase [Arthrobacter halodurans]|uniref:LPXTG-motif cell wall anchor domain-containing protein n=1 Tax=Arthrobacter halodurans TaxID=516699 RepID=A0ABV4UR99_9MICC
MQHRIGVTLTASIALCGLLFAASPAQAAELSQTETVATVSVSSAISAESTTGADAGTSATAPHPVAPALSDAAPTLTSGTAGQGGAAADPTPGGADEGGDTSAPELAGIDPGDETTTPPTTPPTEEPTPSVEPTEPPSEQAGPVESEGPGEPTTDPETSAPGPSAPVPTDSAQPTAPEQTEPPTSEATPEDPQPDGESSQGPAGGEAPPTEDVRTPVDDTVETVETPEGFDDWTEDERYEWFAEQVAQHIDENWDELQNDDGFQRVVGAIEAFILEGDFEGLEAFLMQEFGEDYGFGLGVFDWVLVGLIEDGSLDEDAGDEAIEELPTDPQAPGTKPEGPEGFETPPALVPVGPGADVVAAGSVEGAADASADSRSRQLAATGTDTVVRAGAAGLALLIAGGLLIRLGSRRHRAR